MSNIGDFEEELHRLKRALQNHNDLHQRLIGSNRVVLLLVDPQNEAILAASPRAIEYYGHDRQRLLAMRLGDLVGGSSPKDMRQVPTVADPTFAQHRLADGDVRDVRISSWLGWNEDRDVRYVLVADITHERKVQLETELRERKFQELFHASIDFLLIAEVDADGLPVRFIDVNDFAGRRLGYRREEITGLSHEQVGRICDRHALQKVIPGWQETGQATFETSINAKDGTAIPVEVKGSHLALGQTKVALLVMRDLSERKRSEAELRRSEERCRLILEHSPDGVMIYSGGVIEYANPKAAQLMGVASAAQLQGLPVMGFAHMDSLGVFADCMSRLGKADAIEPVEANVIRPDGSIMTVEANGTAYSIGGQRVIQVAFRDITERKRELARATLLQQMRMARTPRPLPDKLVVEIAYLAAQQISGDLLFLQPLNDHSVLGLVGDGSGKGVAAALNASAMRVAFHESYFLFREPVAVLRHLNQLAMQHFGDDYIAACCFCLDLSRGQLTVASAGIHRFYQDRKHFGLTPRSVEGAPLGMFHDSQFDQINIDVASGDRLWFCTDGLDDLFGVQDFVAQMAASPTLQDQRQQLLDRLLGQKLEDDCTWLGIEIKAGAVR